MWHCLGEALVLLVPPTGATMQGRDQRGGRLLQALAQDLDKQVMVAIPLPFVIEGVKNRLACSRKSSCAWLSFVAHTASHSGALSRSRMLVCNKKSWMPEG